MGKRRPSPPLDNGKRRINAADDVMDGKLDNGWTAEEKRIMEKALQEHAKEPSPLSMYIKIAQYLPGKTVKEVAVFHKWLTTRPTNPKRRSFIAIDDSMLRLVEKTVQDLRQIYANVKANRLHENIGLFHLVRQNIETMLSFARFDPTFEQVMCYFPWLNHMMVDSIQQMAY